MDNPGTQPSGTPSEGQPTMPTGAYTPQPTPPSQPYSAPPPQGYAYPPVPAPPPPKGRSPLLWILVGVLGVIVVCVVGVVLLIGGVFAATQPVVDGGEAYMAALRDGNYSRAFDLSSTSLQKEVSNASGIEDALSAWQPSTWTFTSRSISGDNGQLSGTVAYKDGATGTVDMALTKESNAWKVIAINLK